MATRRDPGDDSDARPAVRPALTVTPRAPAQAPPRTQTPEPSMSGGRRPAIEVTRPPRSPTPMPSMSGTGRANAEAASAPEPVPRRGSAFQVMKPAPLPVTTNAAPTELPLDALTPLAPLEAPRRAPPAPAPRARARAELRDLDPALPPAAASGPPTGAASRGAPAAATPHVHEPTFVPRWDTTPTEVEPPSRAPVIVGVAAAVLVGLSVAGVAAYEFFTPPPPPLTLVQERAAGDAFFRQSAVEPDRLVGPPVLTAVERVVVSVAQPMRERLQNRQARAAVLNAPAEVTLRALPDGTVIVTTGLLLRLASETELAFLAAHALAHVALGDLTERLAGQEHIVIDALAAGTDGVALRPVLMAADAGEDPASEKSADALAIEALRASGWDPKGGHEALKKIGAAPASPWLSRHHVDAARIASFATLESAGRSGRGDYQNQVLATLRPAPAPRPKGAALPRSTAPRVRSSHPED